MLRETIFGLAAFASAAAMAAVDPSSIVPIKDPAQCPVANGGLGTRGVIPHLSTLHDTSGVPFTVTLRHKDGYRYDPTLFHTLALCGFTPDGQFIGGSSIKYTNGSRVWFNQKTGSQNVSLAALLQTTTKALNGREFQLYFGGDSFSTFEYSVSGNNLQQQVFARPQTSSMVGVFLPDARGFVGGVDTVLYISQTSSAVAPACVMSVKIYNEEGTAVVAEPQVTIPPRGVGRVDLGKLAPGVAGAVQVQSATGSCGDVYVSRETTYRSGVPGGKGLFIDTWQ